MKKFYFLLLLGVMLYSCRSIQVEKSGIVNAPINPKLPTLTKRLDDYMPLLASQRNGMDQNSSRVFNHEVEDNLTNPFGQAMGTIALKQTVLQTKMGMGLLFANTFTLFIPMLIGAPLLNLKYTMQVDIRIYDVRGKMVAKYSGIGRGAAPVAMYYGYSITNATTKAYNDAVAQAFAQIRPQVEKDSPSITQKLKEAAQ